MESTGVLGKIQVSQSTADCIVAAGKPHWISPREDTVLAKGKGVMHTFWLNFAIAKTCSSTVSSESNEDSTHGDVEDEDDQSKRRLTVEPEEGNRLEKWMTELLLDSLKKLVSDRQSVRILFDFVTQPEYFLDCETPSSWNERNRGTGCV